MINSCIRPVVARYLQRIEDRLAQAGIAAELLVMQSSGGVYTFAAARQKPVYMVESGPAAGGNCSSASRTGARLRPSDFLRHGRDDRQSRADPRRRAQRDQGLRGRDDGANGRRSDSRRWLSNPHASNRPRRNRRGWRVHRLGRSRRHPPSRSPKRRGRSRASLLWPRRDATHSHRRQPRLGTAQP